MRGNPLGDPNLMGDPGLRSPVIRFSYSQDEEGVSSDLRELQPRGAYSRPFVACKQSENLSEVSSLADYQKELEADASLVGGDSVGLNSFSASAAYRDIAKRTVKRNTKTFILKTYCLRFEAGLAQTDNFNWSAYVNDNAAAAAAADAAAAAAADAAAAAADGAAAAGGASHAVDAAHVAAAAQRWCCSCCCFSCCCSSCC